MKRIKKLLAVMLAAIMVMSMGTSVFAEDETTYTITITNKDESTAHTYQAYQIFTGDLSGSEGSYVLSNIVWGSGVNASSLVSALKTASKTEGNALNGLFDSIPAYDNDPNASAVAVAEALTNITDGSDAANAFAAIVASNLTTTVAGTSTYSTGNGKYTISGLAAGYYFVKDQDSSLSSQTDTAYTSYILEVVANVSIEGKEEAPTLTKSASTTTAAVNDTITYTLTSKVPDVTGYSSYTYEITDTLSAGQTYTDYSIKVAIKETTIESGYSVVTTSNEDGTTTIKISFTDFLTTVENYEDGDAITITYSVTLDGDYNNNNSTDTGDTGDKAFTNKAKLTYSNNPSNSSSKSTTVEVETDVYTTSLIITKTYGSNETVAETVLNGTGFTLYMKLSSSEGATHALVDGELVQVSSLEDDATVTAYYKQIGSEAKPSGSEGTYTLSFVGLDAGEYLLIETSVPDGYNKCADITFTTALNDDGDSWASGTISVNNDGNYAQTINNSAGSTLPTTGGIGTTIFYVVGAILVLGAGVVLITRRRMASR